MLVLVAPLGAAAILEPELDCADVGRDVFDVGLNDHVALVAHDLYRIERVADGAAIQRTFNAIVGGFLAEPYGLAKLWMGYHPAIESRLMDFKGFGDLAIGCALLRE